MIKLIFKIIIGFIAFTFTISLAIVKSLEGIVIMSIISFFILFFLVWRKKREFVNKKMITNIEKKNIIIFIFSNYTIHIVVLCLSVIIGDVPAFVLAEPRKDILLFLFNSGFVAPIVEELYFRKFLLDSFQEYGKTSEKVAIIISSLLFGVTHLNISGIGAFFIGVTYGNLYFRTKSIILLIILHSLRNVGILLMELRIIWFRIVGLIIFWIIPIIILLYLKRKRCEGLKCVEN